MLLCSVDVTCIMAVCSRFFLVFHFPPLCNIVLVILVLHFPALAFGPSFSGPTFFSPDILFLHFLALHLPPLITIGPPFFVTAFSVDLMPVTFLQTVLMV